MPKGEHFKKENPRNFQVSFKVNQIELDLLKEVAAKNNLSIAEWLRSNIQVDKGGIVSHKLKIKSPKKSPTPKVETKKNDQTSLF